MVFITIIKWLGIIIGAWLGWNFLVYLYGILGTIILYTICDTEKARKEFLEKVLNFANKEKTKKLLIHWPRVAIDMWKSQHRVE